MHLVWVKTRFWVKKVTKSNRYRKQKRIFVNVKGKRIDECVVLFICSSRKFSEFIAEVIDSCGSKVFTKPLIKLGTQSRNLLIV